MCETKDKNLEEIREKAIKEIEEYLYKGNEVLGLLFIATGLALSKVDNILVFFGAGVGVTMVSIYFFSKYFPTTLKDLRNKKKQCLTSNDEEKLLKCLEKNYLGPWAFVKKAYVVTFGWVYFWLIFIFRGLEIINHM